MNLKFAVLFLVIAIFIIGGIYFGFLETGNKNLFSQISGVSNNDFQYVGEVVLSPETGALQAESVSEEKKEAPKKASKKQATGKTQIQLFSTSAPASQSVQPNIQIEPIQPTSTIQITETIQLAQTIQIATTTESAAIIESAIVVPVPTSTPAQTPAPTPTISIINHLLISEILFNAQASDEGKEFVELYNPTDSDKNIKNWSLKVLTSGSGTASSLIKFGSKQSDKTIIKSRGFFLVGLNNYSGIVSADAIRSASLPNSAATVYLFDSDGNEIENISYPDDIEEGQSIERVSWDSNEFKIQSTPNPQNSQNN